MTAKVTLHRIDFTENRSSPVVQHGLSFLHIAQTATESNIIKIRNVICIRMLETFKYCLPQVEFIIVTISVLIKISHNLLQKFFEDV